jgi:glycosyltransferase involved in cell wall biosynthesis
MKILRISQRLFPDDSGGAAYHVHAMSRDQAKRGHDVTVLTVGDGPRWEYRDGYEVIRGRSLAAPFGNDISPVVGRFLTDVAAYDIVHAHSHLYFSTNLAAVARRFTDTPLALTNHGLYSQSAPRAVFDAYLRTIGRWTFNAADIVFCYTDTDKRRLRSLGVTSDIAVVPNGIDIDRFRPDGPTSESMIEGDPKLLFVGRLVDGKRPIDAVRALPTVLDTYPDTHLYLCGKGPLERDVREAVRELDLQDRVTLLGHVQYGRMPAVYRSADVLVLPSSAEGLPRTVLEAFACETPAVTTDLDQIAPVVTDAGRTISIGDPVAIGDAVTELISSGGESLDPRDRVVAEFEWSDTVVKTTRILGELSAKRL